MGEECTKEQVEVLFDGWSVELRLKGYKGTNYIFAIKKLCGEIVAGESKFVLKKNSLTIVLVKREGKSWGQLAWKEEKVWFFLCSLGRRIRKRKRRTQVPILWG